MIYFFDTNALAYIFDNDDPVRQLRAKEFFNRVASEHDACLSTQVLIELYNVLTRRLKPRLSPELSQQHLERFVRFRVLATQAQHVLAATQLMQKHRLSWWDALILEAALRADADVLVSEDFSHGQRFGKLVVENPFL
jgi:predicted nucleic acid-binding protein